MYLYFPSYVDLAIHRTCGQLVGAAAAAASKSRQGEVDALELYKTLVRRETERRGLSAQAQQSSCPYQLHHFSATQLDAAHRSVANAKSRAHMTNEIEYARLRQRALDKQRREEKAASRRKRARPSNAKSVCSAHSTGVQPSSQEWPAFLRSLE